MEQETLLTSTFEGKKNIRWVPEFPATHSSAGMTNNPTATRDCFLSNNFSRNPRGVRGGGLSEIRNSEDLPFRNFGTGHFHSGRSRERAVRVTLITCTRPQGHTLRKVSRPSQAQSTIHDHKIRDLDSCMLANQDVRAPAFLEQDLRAGRLIRSWQR